MPVQFLTSEQRANYGRYVGNPTADQLTRYFHLDDTDQSLIDAKRGDHNRLGFALQLTTVRFLGTFLEDPLDVPRSVLQTLVRQLRGTKLEEQLTRYRSADQRWEHKAEIQSHYGFRDWVDSAVGFRLGRWLYALCWTGTEQLSVLFDRATTWLLANKILLPGCTTLERFVARLRNRVEERLWKQLGYGITDEQRVRLENLLIVPSLGRSSWLDKLRAGPVRVSGRALVQAILRLQTVRDLDIKLPAAGIPPSRLASLARFAGTAKVTAISRLPPSRRLATLVAFIHCLEATAHDDVIEVLDILLHDFFSHAGKADKKVRLRGLKDLDQAAAVLASACRAMIDPAIADCDLRKVVFARTSRDVLTQALANVDVLIRPPDDVYYDALDAHYRSIRMFLPTLLQHVQFGASPAGESVAAGYAWLRTHELRGKSEPPAPQEVITKPWRRHVLREDHSVNPRACDRQRESAVIQPV